MSKKTPIEKAPQREVWPLTFTERQMATEQYLNPVTVAYNINYAISISGSFDITKMEQAFTKLVKRHAAFRSYYPMENGDFVHRIAPDLSVQLKQESCVFDDVEDLIKKADAPYDLAQAPLFRFTLFNLIDKAETYVLNFAMHHIIMDGMSFSIIIDDVWRLYNGEKLKDIELEYLDYAVWSESQPENEESKAFFAKMFDCGLPEYEMPTLPRRPDIQPVADIDYERIIDIKPIINCARLIGITVYELLLSATALTLSKYCGNDDVVLGTVMSGRLSPQTAEMVGMFANTVPIRFKTPGDMPIKNYLKEVADVVSIVKKHQTYPFENIVATHAPERNTSRSPLFDLTVNYLHEIPFPEITGVKIKTLPLKRQAIAIDLMLEFLREGDKLRIKLSYSRKLYQDEVITNMMEQFITILSRLYNSGDDNTLNDLTELPDNQRDQILNDFAGKKTDENKDKTLIDFFNGQVIKTPQNRVLVFKEKIFTYQELGDITDRLAVYLDTLGIGRGQVVGILINRSEMMVVGPLGVLKTGAAYMPLDPAYPSDRLEFMIEDAGCKVIIADEDLTDRIPGYKGEFLYTKDITALAAGNITTSPKPTDILVLLYTSGTTGKPKGVRLSHFNLMSFCTFHQKYQNLTENSRISAYASFGFDAHMSDIYPPLMVGACIYVIPEEMKLDLPGLNDYFNENGITHAMMTTQLGRQFVETMPNNSLKFLLVGGETLVPVTPPQKYHLHNGYGPTECTLAVSFFHVDKLYDRVPIGKATFNTSLYIVDKYNRLAPVGVSGELCISGWQVGQGYLNRPDLTAEKFVKNPFSDDPDYATMYRTGDVVRFLPDGNLDFAGRSDFQVKIRGFRVELTEIEERIRAYPPIKDAAVIALDAPSGGKNAVAYIVSDENINIEVLASFIEEKLPSYMVPAATMQIPQIPINQNGKVDRKKLPVPEYDNKADDVNTAGTMSDLGISLKKITAEILKHEDFGMTTNLLRVGLTSLSCIRLVAAIDEKLGVAVPVLSIMQNPVLIGIENAIIALLLSGANKTTDERDIQTVAPLNKSQIGVYLDCQKDPATKRYNMPFMLSLSADIEAEKMRDTVVSVIEAHPGLNIKITVNDGTPVQMLLENPASVLLEEKNEAELLVFREKFVRPFDLAKGPLYRAQIVKTPERVVLFADFHHIAFDGASMDLFLLEIGRVYDGGKPQAEKLSVFNAALDEGKYEGSEDWLKDKAYFEEKLGDFENVSEIEADLGLNEASGFLAEIVKKADRSMVEVFCKSEGITPAALFLAATAYSVSRWIQNPDVYISGISSGRSDIRLQNTCGMFVRTLPLIIKRGDGQSCLDFIRATGQTLNDSVAHEGYPYVNIAQDYGYSPTIMYTNQLGVTGDYEIGGEKIRFEALTGNRPKFKLSVHIEERDGEMVFAVQYNDALYSKTLMERFGETLVLALTNLIKSPTSPVNKVSLLSNEQRLLIECFSKIDNETPELVLHRLFENAVIKAPDSVALIACDGSLTYTELNTEANKVANALLKLGVSKEDRIGILLRRTSRVLIAMLGVMKAGCAYIPLDPDYPEERISHVLNDSGAKYLITTNDIKIKSNHLLDIDKLREGSNPENPNVDVSPDNLAYIIYTSGSTGKPKGVMIEHRGIANYVSPHPDNIHVHAMYENDSRMLSICTVAFDMFLKESMTCLCNGLCLVFAGDDVARDPAKLAVLFNETAADAFNATPSVMLEYTEYPALLTAIKNCKIVMCGAEKFPDMLIKRLKSNSNMRLFNTYGPTEISVSCNGKEMNETSRVNVGAPLYNVCEQVIDSDGNALPCGMVGELLIGGRGVARGYVNLTELTSERFIIYDGVRMYKSGDYARWTLDGEIEILGRSDNQVKLRGLRIELNEVEKAIQNIAGIRIAITQIRKIQNSDHLCAYYTAEREISPDEIKEVLKRTLTGYMIPTAYLQLPEMPKTPGGKTDYRALPTPALSGQENYELPQGEIEEKLCAIFAEVIGLSRVGALDDFFEIGGTSLAVTRLVIACENAGVGGRNGEKISYTAVFTNPTPRALAKLLSSGEVEAAVTTKTSEEKYDYSGINSLLAENTLETFQRGGKRPLGNVLLTGATGFLGIHILYRLLNHTNYNVTCLVRQTKNLSASKRLQNLLYYYFEDGINWEHRLSVFEGDMTNMSDLEMIKGIDTVINCAANVTHFAKDNSTFDVNTGGVNNLIDFCQKNNARLIHVSTASVKGLSVDGYPSHDIVMDETMLYFGQNLDNQYINSKFMAERYILEAAINGLDVKIMRVGNLMARHVDGEFQINAKSNNFLGRLKAYHTVGCFPYSSYKSIVELSPVGITAGSILHLAATSKFCRVFHPYNNHNLFLGDIILTMKELGLNIEMVEDDVFQAAVSSAMKDPKRVENLTSLIAYQNMARGKVTLPVAVKNDFTTQVLLRLNWHWSIIDEEYLQKFITKLIGLGYFDYV